MFNELANFGLVRRVASVSAALFLSTMGVNAATYYVDYSAGSDAAAGTAKATAWKRAPYMKGFAGSYSHSAGDQFIFKGGVSWPNSAFQLNITAGGSSGSPDYYGVDTSWYSGGSFSRPVFDFENILIGPGWSYSAGLLINATGGYFILDNIEFKNHRAPFNGSDWGACTINYTAGSSLVVSNCLIKDWSLATPVTTGRDGGGGGGIFSFSGSGIVIDGCEFHQAGSAVKSGRSMSVGATIRNCTVHDTIMGLLGAGTIYSNTFYSFPDPTDLAQHANVIYTRDPSTIYNNRIHDITPYAQVIYPSPSANGTVTGTTLIHDNVVWNVSQPNIALEMEANTSTGQTVRIFHNTLVGAGGAGTTVRVIYRGNSQTWGTIDVRNNHFITSGTSVGYNNTNAGFAEVLSATVSDNITMTPNDATSYGYTAANGYQPTSPSSPSVTTTGADLGAICCTTDINGNARPPWEIGAYVYGSAPATGIITLSTNAYSASEEAGTVTVTAVRSGGSSGASSVNYGTSDGSATNGVNYVATSGTLNWGNGDAADKTFTVTLIDANTAANPTFSVTLSGASGSTLGSPSAATVTVLGSGTPVDPLLTGYTWPAPSTLGAPFTASGGYYSQAVQTIDLSTGGYARYRFTLTNAGEYTISAIFTNITDSANSVGIDIDSEPTSPTAIWDQPTNILSGKIYASWRGTGTDKIPEVSLKTWTLSPGIHTAIIRGREAYAKFSIVSIEQITPVGVATITSSVSPYFYKAGAVIPITVTFSDTVDYTGAPELTLNSGGTAPVTGGSGTTALTFGYTVGVSDNAEALDVASIDLPVGSTIKHGSTSADLTVPADESPGSLSFGNQIVIDTVPPSISISPPSLTLSTNLATFYFTVNYEDDHFAGSSLTAGDVTVNGITATVSVSTLDNPSKTQTITLKNCSLGVGSISIASGKASDYAGNLAPSAGPSAPFMVSSMGNGVANIYSTTVGLLYIYPQP